MPSPITRATFVAALSLLVVPGAPAHDDSERTAGRLVVADHQTPGLRILDLDTGAIVATLELALTNPRLTTLADGRFVAVRGDDAVHFVDTGLVDEDHGDHSHVRKAAPELLDLVLEGPRPAHFEAVNGQAAFFFDGRRDDGIAASAVVVALDQLTAATPDLRVWESPGPQHGNAVPLPQGQLLVSSPNPDFVAGVTDATSRSIGFRLLDGAGDVVAAFDDLDDPVASCKDYHGYAAARGVYAFGCVENDPSAAIDGGGVLVLRDTGDGTLAAEKLAYPDAGRRAAQLRGHPRGDWIVANYGVSGDYSAFLRVPAAGGPLTADDVWEVPNGQQFCQFAVDPSGRRLVNLTPDGVFRVVDIASFEVLFEAPTTAAFDCAWNATTPKPMLLVGAVDAYVSDPANSTIFEFDLERLQTNRAIAVPGMPANLGGGKAG